jgi:hypothetical protein
MPVIDSYHIALRCCAAMWYYYYYYYYLEYEHLLQL